MQLIESKYTNLAGASTQLYIYDTQHESHDRFNAFSRGRNLNGINLSTIENLQQMLIACNPYVQVFR